TGALAGLDLPQRAGLEAGLHRATPPARRSRPRPHARTSLKAPDFLIVGGGIIGVSVALELRRRHPGAAVTLLEKEPAWGQHASGAAAEARRLEPRVKTFERAVFSPTTSSVDPLAVLRSLVTDARVADITLLPGTAYLGRAGATVRTSSGPFTPGYLVNAAGL